jgi:hypothetical protein
LVRQCRGKRSSSGIYSSSIARHTLFIMHKISLLCVIVVNGCANGCSLTIVAGAL